MGQKEDFLERIEIFNDKKLVKRCFEKFSEEYKQYDPSWYLYNQMSEFEGDRFSDKYIELVYVTLKAWNMDQRRARLAEFDYFKDMVKGSSKLIKKLEKEELDNLRRNSIFEDIEKLMYSLENICKQKTKIVTFSKTMHFMLPDLFVPVDRTYTLNFFRGHGNIPEKLKSQYWLYDNLLRSYAKLSKKHNFRGYKGKWNKNIPKTLDNLIIGYQKLNKK